MTETLLTPPEAADRLRLKEHTLRTMRTRRGGPRFVKLGGKVLYRPSDIESWLRERTFACTQDVRRTRENEEQ